MRWPRSLALRLALAAGLWVAAGLGAAAWFVTDALIFPVFTAVLVAVALVPGLILMRQEPSEIV